ncbi:MAG: hypothetical protein OXE46_03995 [Chloroflexi bacterium]|nr:hypothetical protein [Chloroflexota bacterium]
MKPPGKIIVASLFIFAVCALVMAGLIADRHIEFNGQVYSSIDSAKQAAAVNEVPAILGDDFPFYCGRRLTILSMILGFYGPYDPMVCFTTEAESDQLYAENRAFEARFKQYAERILPFAACAGLALLAALLFLKQRG